MKLNLAAMVGGEQVEKLALSITDFGSPWDSQQFSAFWSLGSHSGWLNDRSISTMLLSLSLIYVVQAIMYS